MNVVHNPPPSAWKALLERPTQKFKQTKKIVSPILKKVKKKGDTALRQFSLEYDHVELNELAVSEAEIQSAREQISSELREAIQVAKENIEKFHRAQHTEPLSVETMPGVRCERRSVPIERVGLYIPGGTAPLFSSVLMLGVPAALAGCREVILCTPPNRKGQVHPAILYTANLVGIRKIFRVGGAQAVAAMAYGTESIPAVYKIVGPGNQYVTVAKQLVSQHGVAIDLPAGSSEVAVLADASANPNFVAADLLSQAEHGVDSQVVLVSTDAGLVERVQAALREQLVDLPRRTIAEQALENSVALVVPDLATAYDLLNEYGGRALDCCYGKSPWGGRPYHQRRFGIFGTLHSRIGRRLRLGHQPHPAHQRTGEGLQRGVARYLCEENYLPGNFARGFTATGTVGGGDGRSRGVGGPTSGR